MKKTKKVVMATLLSTTLFATMIGCEKKTTNSENTVMSKFVENYIEKVDTNYAFEIAKKLVEEERFRTNPALGYSLGGTDAEKAKAEFLYEEMKNIGLQNVTMDEFEVDSWNFEGASIEIFNEENQSQYIIDESKVSSYATAGTPEEGIQGEIIYLNKGTKQDYEGIDVKGKIVLVDIDQRDEWWVTFPALEAYYQGAAALIVNNIAGYGESSDEALNTQDFNGPIDQIPVVCISVNEANKLKEKLENEKLFVNLKLDNSFEKTTSSNIIGEIPGKNNDQIILVGDHYDTYFQGFQDNSTAVGVTLGIAKAMIESGYEPEHTIVFILHGSEEYGIYDSHYDWCHGAWQQIQNIRPEWQGSTITYMNFEMPGYKHGETFAITTTAEQEAFVAEFLKNYNFKTDYYKDGYEANSPQGTWADDIAYSFSGVPGMMNAWYDIDFLVNMYHSQLDTIETYDENALKECLRVFGALTIEFDQSPAIELDFTKRMTMLKESLKAEEAVSLSDKELLEELENVITNSDKQFNQADELNKTYIALKEKLKADENNDEIKNVIKEIEEIGKNFTEDVLNVYKSYNSDLSKLDWYDNQIFGHEQPQANIELLSSAIEYLKNGDADSAIDESLLWIEDEFYSPYFSQYTIDYWTDSVINGDKEKNAWGYGRIVGYVDLFDTINSIMAKIESGETNFDAEIEELEKVKAEQVELLEKCLNEEVTILNGIATKLEKIDIESEVTKYSEFLKTLK